MAVSQDGTALISLQVSLNQFPATIGLIIKGQSSLGHITKAMLYSVDFNSVKTAEAQSAKWKKQVAAEGITDKLRGVGQDLALLFSWRICKDEHSGTNRKDPYS